MIQENLSYTSLGDPVAAALFLPAGPGPHPALVACHGALAFKENLFELCEYLANQGLACLAPDMHGHGESGGERYHVEMRQWTPDVRAALDCLSADPRIDANRLGAFGHSSGGTAVLEAALAEPRLKAIISLDATVRNSLEPMESIGIGALNWAGRVKKALTRRNRIRQASQWIFIFLSKAGCCSSMEQP